MSQSVVMSHSVCVMHVFSLSVCLQTQSVVMSHSICVIHVFSHSVSCNDTDCCRPKLNPQTLFIRGDQGFQYKCECHGTKCTYTKFLVSTRLAEQYMCGLCKSVLRHTHTHLRNGAHTQAYCCLVMLVTKRDRWASIPQGQVICENYQLSVLIVYSRYT
jgi:hypothetical protein